MESCSCAHEQQVRHLKSRVGHLEIMLDKAQKRINAQTSAMTASPPASPQMMVPRTISVSDVRRSEEYRRLQADLESEKRVKMDLMANLKELTTTNEAAQARLVQELEGVKAQHEVAMTNLDEIQEEFERLRVHYDPTSYSAADQSRIDSANSQAAAASHNTEVHEGDTEARISASVVRSLATHIEEVQEQRIQSILHAILQSCPKELVSDTSQQSSDALAAQVTACIAKLKTGYVDESGRQALRHVLNACGGESRLSEQTDVDKLVQTTCTSVTKRFEDLETSRNTLMDLLYRAVPATLEDFFNLFARASSFSYPDRPASTDAISRDSFETYLKSTGTNLSHTIRKYISSHQKSRQKISYRGFAAGDLALFLPTRNANSPAWAAFNVGAPHYFLSMDGVDTEGKDFLIGRIQEIVEKSGEPGVDSPSTVAGVAEVRKWWEVKIQEKKKVNAV